MLDITLLYQEVILDHWRHPKHFGSLPFATHQAIGYNPLCGDEITLFLELSQEKIQKIQFVGKGCAICIASASLMCELLEHKPATTAMTLFELFIKQYLENNNIDLEKLGKTKVLSQVKHFPMRVKCATLPWHTFKAALLKQTEAVTTET